MLGYISLTGAVAMTAVAVWRLPALWYGDPLRRALCACLAGFALALWCRVPAVKYWMDHSPITDLSALGKYLTSMAALVALLDYVRAVHGGNPDRPHSRHPAGESKASTVVRRAVFAAMAAMVILFFAAIDRDVPTTDFATDHAGEWGAVLFMTIEYSCLSATSAACSYQWGRASRRAETRLLSAGLLFMAAGAAVYAIYPVLRIPIIWFPSGISAVTMRSVADVVNLLAAVLFGAGASIPTAKALAARRNAWHTLRGLHPLWRDLLAAFPVYGFHPPAVWLRELWRTSPALEVRVDRWVQEIADVVEQLRHHATPELFVYAESHAEGADDPAPAAEALWIKAALHAANEGCRADTPVLGLPSKPLADIDAESQWLLRVVKEYRNITNEQIEQLLNVAGTP
ncbi:MAB_1171c family putative transporter [Streptomyces sp. NPDC002746]